VDQYNVDLVGNPSCHFDRWLIDLEYSSFFVFLSSFNFVCRPVGSYGTFVCTLHGVVILILEFKTDVI